METNSRVSSASALVKISLLGLCSLASTASAGAKTEPAIAGRLQPEEGQGAHGLFGLGATRRTVLAIAGLPDERMGDLLWIYYQCGLTRDDPRAKGCDALIVVFQKDRVRAMKLTDSAALRTLVAQQKLKVTGPSYADLLR